MRLRWVVALGSFFAAGCGPEVLVLGRNDYKHFTATCEKGINQQVENADPVRECLDARNVWAPDGRVAQRPGYVGLSQVEYLTGFSTPTFFARAEDVSAGTFTSPVAGVLTLSNLVGRVTSGGDGDRWYIGSASTFDGVQISVTQPNSNATRTKVEYWNGSSWVYLASSELNTFGPPHSFETHLASGGAIVIFAKPRDWASTTVNGQAAYWIRFNLLDANIDANCTVTVSSFLVFGNNNIRGMSVAEFSSTKRYFFVNSDAAVLQLSSTATPDMDDFSYSFPSVGAGLAEPPAIAVVSEFNEAYLAYNYVPFRLPMLAVSFVGAALTPAPIEDRDAAIGPGAPFDRNLIVQDASFPQAKYITFFKNRLWAANLLGNPTAVKWSGRSPYYRVWPTLSEEPLVEDDNSPITGITGFHENLVVTKEDSIWTMREDGLNEFSLTQYTPVRVVPGIGSVSNSSMVEVEGRLFMLWENGLYAFDGTPNIDRVSKGKGGGDRLADVWASITPGRRPFACAVNWSTMGLYLLAVSVDGSETNNLVVAYDYRNDAFWLWDDIEAQHWLRDQGADDEEIIYFGDSAGRIYQLGVGRTDHGGTISSYYTTHRLGYEDGVKKVLREARLHGDSAYLSAQVDIYANDKATANQTATIDFSDPVETVNYRPLERRSRRGDFRVEGDWFQVKVSNATKNTELHSGLLKVGYMPIARR